MKTWASVYIGVCHLPVKVAGWRGGGVACLSWTSRVSGSYQPGGTVGDGTDGQSTFVIPGGLCFSGPCECGLP